MLSEKSAACRICNEVWSYINPFMLFGRHLGFRGNFEKALAEHDARAIELYQNMEEVKQQAAEFMKIGAVWQFFEAERRGNSIALFAPGEAVACPYISFSAAAAGRQALSERLRFAAREWRARSRGVVRGYGGRGHSRKIGRGESGRQYLYSHGLQALAIETAEACAEWLHRRIREDWGFPDPPTMTMPDRFTSRYRGKRYSFGYPACPNLEDQAGIWMLLRPEEIGVHLTEGMMMDPEASVSALVFHHPDCTYFSVGE